MPGFSLLPAAVATLRHRCVRRRAAAEGGRSCGAAPAPPEEGVARVRVDVRVALGLEALVSQARERFGAEYDVAEVGNGVDADRPQQRRFSFCEEESLRRSVKRTKRTADGMGDISTGTSTAAAGRSHCPRIQSALFASKSAASMGAVSRKAPPR